MSLLILMELILIGCSPVTDVIGRKHTANTIRYLARQEVAPAIALSYFLSNHKKLYLEYL